MSPVNDWRQAVERTLVSRLRTDADDGSRCYLEHVTLETPAEQSWPLSGTAGSSRPALLLPVIAPDADALVLDDRCGQQHRYFIFFSASVTGSFPRMR